jgi:hypothetical protein
LLGKPLILLALLVCGFAQIYSCVISNARMKDGPAVGAAAHDEDWDTWKEKHID